MIIENFIKKKSNIVCPLMEKFFATNRYINKIEQTNDSKWILNVEKSYIFHDNGGNFRFKSVDYKNVVYVWFIFTSNKWNTMWHEINNFIDRLTLIMQSLIVRSVSILRLSSQLISQNSLKRFIGSKIYDQLSSKGLFSSYFPQR